MKRNWHHSARGTHVIYFEMKKKEREEKEEEDEEEEAL